MSAEEVLEDLAHLNFSHAWERLKDWWNTDAPAWLKTFVSKAETDAGKLLSSLAETAAQDVIAGGLTTASFVAAGKDVLAKLAEQGCSFAMQEVMAAINLAVAAFQATAPVEAPVAAPESPASSDPVTDSSAPVQDSAAPVASPDPAA